MLAFFFAPGIGLLIYILFGRDRKAFSRQRDLLRQDLEGNALSLLCPALSRQDAEIARLEQDSPGRRKLMQLVRRNSYSALTKRNRVSIQQDATAFYPSLIVGSDSVTIRVVRRHRLPFGDIREVTVRWRLAHQLTLVPKRGLRTFSANFIAKEDIVHAVRALEQRGVALDAAAAGLLKTDATPPINGGL